MVEVTSVTLGGIITVIVLQLLDLGQTYFKNLKRSECMGIKMEMKDEGGENHHNQHLGNIQITETHNHYESKDNSEDSSDYND